MSISKGAIVPLLPRSCMYPLLQKPIKEIPDLSQLQNTTTVCNNCLHIVPFLRYGDLFDQTKMYIFLPYTNCNS